MPILTLTCRFMLCHLIWDTVTSRTRVFVASDGRLTRRASSYKPCSNVSTPTAQFPGIKVSLLLVPLRHSREFTPRSISNLSVTVYLNHYLCAVCERVDGRSQEQCKVQWQLFDDINHSTKRGKWLGQEDEVRHQETPCTCNIVVFKKQCLN